MSRPSDQAPSQTARSLHAASADSQDVQGNAPSMPSHEAQEHATLPLHAKATAKVSVRQKKPQASVWHKARQRLNVWLYRRGVRQSLLRSILRIQIAVASLCVAVGLGIWPLSSWLFWCGIAAYLSVFNFFSLTKQAPQFMLKKYGPSSGIVLFVRTQLRILLTIGIGMVCVVWIHAPIIALLSGLSLSMLASVWAVCAGRRKVTRPA